MTRVVELRGARKSLRGLSVLHDISLEVGGGDVVALLGPSGAGKSTILRLLTGELQPDGGTVASPFGRIALLPQRDALMPWRRVLENATLGLEVQGLRRSQAIGRVRPLLSSFGLEGFERHYPSELSGGMRQRAALLRTVVQNRDALLLDEPFSALDALTRITMQNWLESLWLRHRWTVLLVTHDVREAVVLADRAYVLSPRPARVLCEVPIPLPRPRAAERGSPEMTAIEAHLLSFLLSPQ